MCRIHFVGMRIAHPPVRADGIPCISVRIRFLDFARNDSYRMNPSLSYHPECSAAKSKDLRLPLEGSLRADVVIGPYNGAVASLHSRQTFHASLNLSS